MFNNNTILKVKSKIKKTKCAKLLKKYYDSSTGTIKLSDFTLSCLIVIDCGVKQGGILSPFLFNFYIDDLIIECIDAQVGAIFKELNVSIIVYADGILLISPVDSHLQYLLHICESYGNLWRIKFNPKKSNIIEFGPQFFPNNKFYINGTLLPKTDKIKYLGVEIDSKLNFDLTATEKFKNVQKSIFSMSFLGLSPMGVTPFLQSFIYKTYCLSQFTYALETSTLRQKTRDYLNVCQNNIIRQTIGLNKFCHMSHILSALKIHKFDHLYIKAKLSFINSIKFNELSSSIFNSLVASKQSFKRYSGSFGNDIIFLEKHFSCDIGVIKEKSVSLMTSLNNFSMSNGVTDSIRTCLNNYKSKFYKNILREITKPVFIRDDEEFQELLQYFIITGVPH